MAFPQLLPLHFSVVTLCTFLWSFSALLLDHVLHFYFIKHIYWADGTPATQFDGISAPDSDDEGFPPFEGFTLIAIQKIIMISDSRLYETIPDNLPA